MGASSVRVVNLQNYCTLSFYHKNSPFHKKATDALSIAFHKISRQ